ncbi:TetR family transcriptional regulator C-terminal domain-containing protein [Streptomyces sp. NBC_01483]|uniref:TetR family transcriptional regulator C-terminal domain-containing protein n=1 Tax=Streptomyces sp. NBC_01483 TaxID=2903883 RepID=UPI003FCC3195
MSSSQPVTSTSSTPSRPASSGSSSAGPATPWCAVRGLERWRDALIEHNALRNGAYGCPLGSLASELADQDEEARKAIARHFDTWEGLLDAGLERMKASGVLRANADAGELATGLMAALQSGVGTLDKATEVLELRKHGLYDQPVVLRNTAG